MKNQYSYEQMAVGLELVLIELVEEFDRDWNDYFKSKHAAKKANALIVKAKKALAIAANVEKE
jgi:hypothetical protein